MFWPIVLPLTITCCLLAAFIALMTALAPILKWKRGTLFGLSLLLALIVLIPSCLGIMSLMDSRRFGTFQYSTYADVKDFRVERYLPTSARNITLNKLASGHRAKYSISETELMAHLDRLWDESGERSSISRDDMNDGVRVPAESIEHIFKDLGWPSFYKAIKLHSPVQRDGGGATYYFDPISGTVYHRAGYW